QNPIPDVKIICRDGEVLVHSQILEKEFPLYKYITKAPTDVNNESELTIVDGLSKFSKEVVLSFIKHSYCEKYIDTVYTSEAEIDFALEVYRMTVHIGSTGDISTFVSRISNSGFTSILKVMNRLCGDKSGDYGSLNKLLWQAFLVKTRDYLKRGLPLLPCPNFSADIPKCCFHSFRGLPVVPADPSIPLDVCKRGSHLAECCSK